MRPLVFIVLATLVGAGYYQSQAGQQAPAVQAKTAETSRLGFVSAPAFDRADRNVVTVITSDDAPQSSVQRAQRLAQALRDQGIPTVLAPPVNAAAADHDPATAQRLAVVTAGDQPLILVRGKARSNPMAEIVILEYRGL